MEIITNSISSLSFQILDIYTALTISFETGSTYAILQRKIFEELKISSVRIKVERSLSPLFRLVFGADKTANQNANF